jgi:hypothetical protein
MRQDTNAWRRRERNVLSHVGLNSVQYLSIEWKQNVRNIYVELFLTSEMTPFTALDFLQTSINTEHVTIFVPCIMIKLCNFNQKIAETYFIYQL